MPKPVLFPFAGGQVALYSHRSPVKSTPNEDSAAVIRVDDSTGLLVIADGVGGFRGGDRASTIVTAMIRSAVQYAGAKQLRAAVLDGIEEANRVIMQLGIGAGTTVVVLEIRDQQIRPYHVGDSAIVGMSQRGKIRLQTVPHSPVGYAVESGYLNPHEAMRHEERHLVSNIVGASDMRIEVGASVPVSARDSYVLATDGLYDNLSVPEIVDICRIGPLHRSAERLVHEAARRMTSPKDDQVSKPDDVAMLVWRPHIHASDRSKHLQSIDQNEWSERVELSRAS